MAAPERPLPAAVLWDMDGTIIDTEPYWIAAEYDLVNRRGNGAWSEEHSHNLVGFDLRDAANYLREHGGVDMDTDDIIHSMMDIVIERVRRHAPWRPGALELLDELADAGVPCALVTMSWRPLAEAVLDQLPPDTFAAVVTGDDVAKGKPHPEPYRTAAARLGVDARDCVAIEDSPTGLRSAVAAGCRTVAVPNLVELPPSRDYRRVTSLAHVDLPYLQSLWSSRRRPRGATALTIVVALAIAIGGAAFGISQLPKAKSPPDATTPVQAWAPYWALDRGLASLRSNADALSQVSPFWHVIDPVAGAGAVTVADYVPEETAAQFLAAARAAGVPIVPAVIDHLPAGEMAAVLASPERRRAHIDALVRFADEIDAAGLDLDYEQFAFADGRATWATTRPNWVSFVEELSRRLRADGRTLSVSVPPIYDDRRASDSGYWVYDYAAIEPFVDQIRVMAYDYSTSEPGPIAPLSYVERAIKGATSLVRDDHKIVLGLPTYGTNWVVATEGTCPADAPGRTSVTQANVEALIETRGAAPRYDPTTAESSFTYQVSFGQGATECTQTRQVNYVPEIGTLARMDLARAHHLGGVSLWALGFDSDATWGVIRATTTPRVAPTDNAAGPSART